MLVSSNNGQDSHKAGQNCQSCHSDGGNGKGWFTVAGTVYDASRNNVNPNGTVQLYSGPNETGTLLMTIEVDGKGNFYTTSGVQFGDGIYTSVTGAGGNTRVMITPITSGACNDCHGSVTERIWVD